MAVVALINNRIGTLSAATAFGKSVVAANIIAQRKTNTLILVHTKALMEQWQSVLNKILTRKYGMLFCFRTATFIVHFGNKMNKQDLINIT